MRIFLFVLILFFSNINVAQESEYARSVINKLSSDKFYGRGYVKNGDKKAAKYLRKAFKKNGITSLSQNYFQAFSFPMNSFPGRMEIKLDGKTITPVKDYVVAPDCKSYDNTFNLHYLPEAADTLEHLFDSISKIDYGTKFIVAPLNQRKLLRENPFKAAGVIIPSTKVYWWASTGHSVSENSIVVINDSILRKQPNTIDIEIENKFFDRYNSQNVVGYIPGSEKPDSFIVFTAHFDHLGAMGKHNIFRGANDNASGTAMVLDLAKHFSINENPKYSIAFLLFAAEESGLIGSHFFADYPLLPLANIKALINLDMVGTGSEGISIVNGKINPKITNHIVEINDRRSYFNDVRIGKESCNSDHCAFQKKGVPSVFIFTRGKEFNEYHNLNDNPEKLPLTKFSELKKLLVEFAQTY